MAVPSTSPRALAATKATANVRSVYATASVSVPSETTSPHASAVSTGPGIVSKSTIPVRTTRSHTTSPATTIAAANRRARHLLAIARPAVDELEQLRPQRHELGRRPRRRLVAGPGQVDGEVRHHRRRGPGEDDDPVGEVHGLVEVVG